MDMPGLPAGFEIDEAQSRQYGFPVAVNAEGQRMRYRAPGAKAVLPVGVQKLQDSDLEIINAASSMNTTLGSTGKQLEDGALDLGPVRNYISEKRNLFGLSTPESRNYASFRANLEKLRNDSLRLNKGVQTEGDAQRAWNELLANVNDEKLVAQRLREIAEINGRAIAFRSTAVNQRRVERGLPPLDIEAYQVRPEKQSNPVPRNRARKKPPLPAPARTAHREMLRSGKLDLKQPLGSAGNPYIARDDATASRLPKGSFVILPNGAVARKDF